MPEWLKIENLIGKLNLSSWFRGWFKREHNIEVHVNNTYNIQLNSVEVTAKKIGPDEVPEQIIVETGFEFSSEERFLIDKVNQVHKFNGSDYNFESSYRLALQHIRNKESPDWHNSSAVHLANSIQSGDINLGIDIFFNSFKTEEDPQKIEEFEGLKDKIKYCYKRLQNLRHVDKSGELKREMISEYHRKITGRDEISDQDCQQIFTDFQRLLLELFRKYEIK